MRILVLVLCIIVVMSLISMISVVAELMIIFVALVLGFLALKKINEMFPDEDD